MEYVTVYDQSGKLLGVLENADEIAYTLTHNDLWTASFSLPSGEAKNALCQAHNMVRLPDETRKTGLYRIVGMPSSEETAEGGRKTYSLEHVMATLLDDVLFGYHEIGGTGVTTAQVIAYILDRQTVRRWALGVCEFSDQFAYKFENASLLSALLSLGNVLTDDFTWDFDTTTTPWTVNLRHADATPGCGIHYMRNMVGIEKTMDASALVTRLYLLGYGEGCNFIASDVTAIIKHTRDISYMDDGEVAVVTADEIQVFDALGQPVEKQHSYVDWDVSAAEKGGYAHFMFKEIMEQPEAVRKTILPRIKNKLIEFEELSLSDEYIASLSKIFIIACGSSYHVGMVGRYNLERLLRKPVEVMLASEFRYADPLVDEHTLVVVISQSGETLDSMAALREAKSLGARILSIVNVVGSSIARESDDVLYTWAGPEIAVATTKAYSTQLVLLDMFGVWLAKKTGSIKPSDYALIVEELLALPEKMESVLENIDEIKYLASRYFNHNSVFYIGRNLDYALGLEGSLKLKEISYIHSEAYAAGELKHGTISLIEEGTLVVALCTYAPLFDKAVSNIVEVQARGADVIALTTEGRRRQMGKTVENVLTVPDTHLILQPSLGVIPLQLFAYYVALQRGCDIDKPRNLAKSVTVE